MWSSSLSCQKASEQKQTPQGTVNCPQRLEPSGTQWIQIQWGWTYGERQVMTGLGPTGFSPRYHQSVPNVAAQTGSPCDPPGSFRPASVNQFTQQPGHEVLNTDINPRTGQPEKNFTKLAEGQACSIPEDAAGSLPKVRTFYTINANGTYAESKGWVARMGANGPYFVKEFPG
jgi:hypothetical protein